jgi:hypothetical protein
LCPCRKRQLQGRRHALRGIYIFFLLCHTTPTVGLCYIIPLKGLFTRTMKTL